MASQADLSKRLLLIFYRIYSSVALGKGNVVSSQTLLHFVNNHISTPISERTLQRNIKEICNILHIQICYNSKRGGYTIAGKEAKLKKAGTEDPENLMNLHAFEEADLKKKLALFHVYDPLTNLYPEIPDLPGNYIFLIRHDCTFPALKDTLVFSHLKLHDKAFNVLYTGISTKERLRKRICNRHFGNNSGKSTLRKSLGRLFGFRLIPRDKNRPDDGYKKFCGADEEKLTRWMKENLIVLYYCRQDNYEALQDQLIAYLNPPLNIKDNHHPTNLEFRKKLKQLRTGKLEVFS